MACCQNAVVTRCSCGAVSGHVYLLHILSCLKVPANRTRQLQFNRRLARPEGGGRQHGSGAWPEQIVCLRYIFYGNKYASTFAAVIVARRTAQHVCMCVRVCLLCTYICVLAGAVGGSIGIFLQFYGTCDSSFACLIYFMAIAATQRSSSGLGLLFI